MRSKVRPKSPTRIGKTYSITSMTHAGAELLFEIISQRYEGDTIIITSNLPFDEWTDVFGSERLTSAILDRLSRHVHILEMNGETARLRQSRKAGS